MSRAKKAAMISTVASVVARVRVFHLLCPRSFTYTAWSMLLGAERDVLLFRNSLASTAPEQDMKLTPFCRLCSGSSQCLLHICLVQAACWLPFPDSSICLRQQAQPPGQRKVCACGGPFLVLGPPFICIFVLVGNPARSTYF